MLRSEVAIIIFNDAGDMRSMSISATYGQSHYLILANKMGGRMRVYHRPDFTMVALYLSQLLLTPHKNLESFPHGLRNVNYNYKLILLRINLFWK